MAFLPKGVSTSGNINKTQAAAQKGAAAKNSPDWVGYTNYTVTDIGGGGGSGTGGGGGVAAPPPVYTAADGSKWGSSAEAARRNGEIGIHKSYYNFRQDLDNIYEQTRNRQDTSLKQIANMFGQQKTGLETQRNIAEERFGAEEQAVQSERSRGLRDVAKQVRSTIESGKTLLGTRNAADSSAAELVPLLIGQEGASARGDVLGQSGEQLAQIGFGRAESEAQFNDQTRKLEQWKANQEDAAIRQYENIRTLIRRQQAGANREEQIALANLAVNMANQLGSRLDQIQSQFNQASKEFEGALKTQQPDLKPMDISQGARNFQRQSIQPGQVRGLSFGG